jgi:hypothetical protein
MIKLDSCRILVGAPPDRMKNVRPTVRHGDANLQFACPSEARDEASKNNDVHAYLARAKYLRSYFKPGQDSHNVGRS